MNVRERLATAARWLTPGRRGLLLLAAVLLLAAALQPRMALLRPVHSFLFVVDISMSMHTRDMRIDGEPVSRAVAVQRSLTDAIRALPCGTRAGVGLFAGYQTTVLYLPVEVCSHFNELAETIGGISPQSIWASDSEIAKGIYNAISFLDGAEGRPQLVFITDGHEAPPVSPRYRAQFQGTPGEVPGWLVGVGSLALSPIPKIDERGRQVGVWQEQEVAQTDLFSAGRRGSGEAEQMVQDETPVDAGLASRLQLQPGKEHLTQLRETYLKLLAEELQMDYVRLGDGTSLARRLMAGPASEWRWVPTRISQGLAALALVCLVFAYWRGDRSPLAWAVHWLTWPWHSWRQWRTTARARVRARAMRR